jgi:DNA (cytosine-5)-methyltransferase 1
VIEVGDRFFRSETDARPPLVRLYDDEGCLDGFAGGGGASTGIEMVLGRSPDVAINHDKWALAMHEANHPTTRHIPSNIRKVSYRDEMRGKRCRFAWFSPDCTFFSKARGGAPFRDRNLARRIRGLAWEVVRCAIEIRPDVIFMENVEEYQDWCPLGTDGRPDPKKKGSSFRRWVSRLRNLGAQVEWRQLRASHFGAPTSRKRLFVIIRFDGQPIVWPEPTHGPGRQAYRTAAECIDFSLPVPSIFLTPKEAKAWGQAHGVAGPKRPLAKATKRRIARGVHKFVLTTPEPFIVNNLTNNVPRVVSEPLATTLTGNHKYLVQPTVAPLLVNNSETRDDRAYPADEPIRTLTALGCRTMQLVTPFLAAVRHQDDSHLHPVTEPIRTIPASDREFALVAPSLVRIAHGERDRKGKKRGKGELPATEPLPTQTGSNEFALMAATLINTRNGERQGQAPRVIDIQQPFTTVTAAGSQGALVAAFLAKHNGGHEATGQQLGLPIDTVTARDSKAIATVTAAHLQRDFGASVGGPVDAPAPTITAGGGGKTGMVASHLVKLRGGLKDHQQTAQDVREPAPTLTAGGTHVAEVRTTLLRRDALDPEYLDRAVETCAFLVKYYGTGVARSVDTPAGTITTKDRLGLVTVILVSVGDSEYVLVDIGMRMLTPAELFRCQGFPSSYEITTVPLLTDLGIKVLTKLTKKAQTRLVGNSVPPHLAAALLGANLARPVGRERAA